MTACKTCGAPIIWASTINDKPIPVDSDAVENGNIVLEKLADGVLLARVLGSPALAEHVGLKFVSHFASCRNAGFHRNPR
jgi:hypothetical protein